MKKRSKYFGPRINVYSAMAKSSNLPAKKYKAGERTITRLRFNVQFDGGSPDHDHAVYIDLGQALSVVNQRFYRSGLYYYVQGVTVHNSGDAWVRFSTAPDNYVTKLAWARGFRMWQKMNRLATEGVQGNIYPKYHDFKVFLDDDHYAKATATTVDDNIIVTPGNVLPVAYPKHGALGGVTLDCNEWTMSMYNSPDPGDHAGNDIQLADTFTAHLVGPDETSSNETTSVGLIQSWQITRPLADPSSGEPVTYSNTSVQTDPLFMLFDDGDTHQEILDDLLDHNDLTPYDRDQPFGYGDDELMLQCQITTTDENHIGVGPGFCAPLGLIRVDCDIDDTLEFVLDIVPGPYHGVYAERVL